jgi:hypothetical protein
MWSDLILLTDPNLNWQVRNLPYVGRLSNVAVVFLADVKISFNP